MTILYVKGQWCPDNLGDITMNNFQQQVKDALNNSPAKVFVVQEQMKHVRHMIESGPYKKSYYDSIMRVQVYERKGASLKEQRENKLHICANDFITT